MLAADHPARGALGLGGDPMAMADRRELLDRLVKGLALPGVDGLLGSPDVIEELLLLGALEGKVVVGSMNRSGLAGAVWELDDRFTAYRAETLVEMGFDGGKMLLRFDYSDPGTNATLEACALAITELASHNLIAMVEPLPARRTESGAVAVSTDVGDLVTAVSVASALGTTSAHTWLKLPPTPDAREIMAATTLPALLLGGDPAGRWDEVVAVWREAMQIPNVRGLVAGRGLLYPDDGEVETAVSAAAEIVHGGEPNREDIDDV